MYNAITDIGYVAIIPTVSVLGLIFNLISVVILSNKSFKETMYKFLLANSIIDSIYLFVISFLPIARCIDICSLSSKFLPKFYELYGFLFMTHVLSTASSLTSVSVAYDRFFSLSKINRCKWKFNVKLVLLFYFCFSFLNQLPTILSFKLSKDVTNYSNSHFHYDEANANKTHFHITLTKFGESREAKLLIIILQVNINLTPTTLVIIANILLLLKLRRQAFRQKQLQRKMFFSRQNASDIQMISFNFNGSSDSQSDFENDRNNIFSKRNSKIERNLTSMIVIMSMIYVFGRFANTISATLFLFFNRHAGLIRLLILLCNVVEFSTYGMNLFVFYAFDKNFSRILNKHFDRLLKNRFTL